MVAGGDTSLTGGDPSMKKATHSTTVPLYYGSAGMVRVYTVTIFIHRARYDVIEPSN